MQAFFHRGGPGGVALWRQGGAELRGLARKLGGGARRLPTAQGGQAVGTPAIGGGYVPGEWRTGFFEQAVQAGAVWQGRCLGVAAAHPVLQVFDAQFWRAHQGTQRLAQRLQWGHAPGVHLLPAGDCGLARCRGGQAQQAGRQQGLWSCPTQLFGGRQGHAFQHLQHAGRWQQGVGQRAGIGGGAELARVVGPGGGAGNERVGLVVVGFKPGLVEVGLGLQRCAQHGRGQAQALGFVLRGAAAQGQQGQGALLRTHHLALAAHQGV